MKDGFNVIISDKILRISIGLSLCFLLIVTALIAVFYQQLPPFIPFFNSMPWGTDRLYTSLVVVFVPLVFLLVLFANTVISIKIYQKHTLFARMVSFNGLLFVVLGFLAYVQILLLVF